MYTLLILKTGQTFADLAARRGDFEDWFGEHLSPTRPTGVGAGVRLVVVDAQTRAVLPPLRAIDGIVVTGSSSAVHDHEPWSVRAGAWLSAAVQAGMPVLGVCYGHQLLATFSGGTSGKNPAGREIGMVEVTTDQADPLFDGLPPRFSVLTSHCDTVLSAPPQSRILARNDNSAIQALAFGERTRTVQWHPEFDADVMRHYLLTRAALIDAESGAGTTERRLAELREVPTGPLILRNFLRHYVGAR
jgi:GMP synthase (glutamine-hydrolysing)